MAECALKGKYVLAIQDKTNNTTSGNTHTHDEKDKSSDTHTQRKQNTLKKQNDDQYTKIESVRESYSHSYMTNNNCETASDTWAEADRCTNQPKQGRSGGRRKIVGSKVNDKAD